MLHRITSTAVKLAGFIVAFLILLLALLLVSGSTAARPLSSPVGQLSPEDRTVLAAAVPAQFTEAEVIGSLSQPTALAFLPDGRLLITTQAGRLYLHTPGSATGTEILNLVDRTPSRICNNSERGLLGLAVDPDFNSNGFIYIYYTFNRNGQGATSCSTGGSDYPVNRVSRFTFSSPGGSLVNLASETVLLDHIPSPAGNHNGGDLHFGQDGLLYISVGDGGCELNADNTKNAAKCAGANAISRKLNVILGKILRINKDGTIPASNPRATEAGSRRCGDPAAPANFQGSGACREMFSWGLRNPFRFAFRPGTSNFYINDVGQNLWEEINNGQSNADYGWNVREGHCLNGSTTNCPSPTAGMVDPLHDYLHSATGCYSITGGAFVPVGLWPAAYDGKYLFADYVCNKIFRLDPDGAGGFTRFELATGAGNPVALAFGPYNGPNGQTQALYYTSYATNSVRRIAYTGAANRPPTASFTVSPAYGPVPLTVSFNAAASSDPDAGDSLTYYWDFGDGATAQTADPTTGHTYNTPGAYFPSLVVRDNRNGVSNTYSQRIDANNSPPVPRILSPATTDRFRVGQSFVLSGQASDPQDGALPASALTWTVRKKHFNHYHPFYGPVAGNNLTVNNAPPPEDLDAAGNSYLEIELAATDSQGLTASVTHQFLPRQVTLSFASSPTGRTLELNGVAYTAPVEILSWEGYQFEVNAPSPQIVCGGQTYTFTGWSDGGAARHTIETPASATTYTASFSSAVTNVAVVSKGTDDDSPGTLRRETQDAAPGASLCVQLGPQANGTIRLTRTLNITKPVNIIGVCGSNGPEVQINPDPNAPASPIWSGLVLSGGASLTGLHLAGFSDRQLVAGAGRHRLKCIKTTK